MERREKIRVGKIRLTDGDNNKIKSMMSYKTMYHRANIQHRIHSSRLLAQIRRKDDRKLRQFSNFFFFSFSRGSSLVFLLLYIVSHLCYFTLFFNLFSSFSSLRITKQRMKFAPAFSLATKKLKQTSQEHLKCVQLSGK